MLPWPAELGPVRIPILFRPIWLSQYRVIAYDVDCTRILVRLLDPFCDKQSTDHVMIFAYFTFTKTLMIRFTVLT